MLEEIVKFLVEDFLSDAFAGLFRRANSPRIRRWKSAAWFCVVTGTFLFVLAGWQPQILGFETSILLGLAAIVVALVSGFWASVAHLGYETRRDKQAQ